MTIKKQRRLDSDIENRNKNRHPERVVEKHLRNAVKGKTFNINALSDAERDELGFDEDYEQPNG